MQAAPKGYEVVLYESVALGDGSMTFQPLLPSDDASIGDRTSALGEWCQGFLYGLGTGSGLPEASDLEGEAADLLERCRILRRTSIRDVSPRERAQFEALAQVLQS